MTNNVAAARPSYAVVMAQITLGRALPFVLAVMSGATTPLHMGNRDYRRMRRRGWKQRRSAGYAR